MTKGKNQYSSSPNPANRGGGIVSRIIMYIIIGLIIPFELKRIRNQLIKEERFRCERCNKKMQMINQNEYYCKDCKIIRLDDR